jgi:capsid protein
VSPKTAAQRAYFRNVMELQARAYDAAKTGRRTDGWYAPTTGANAEIGPAAAKIRARVHELVRNDPHAAPIPRKWASKIVGTGIQPRLAIEGDDADTVAKRARLATSGNASPTTATRKARSTFTRCSFSLRLP